MNPMSGSFLKRDRARVERGFGAGVLCKPDKNNPHSSRLSRGRIQTLSTERIPFPRLLINWKDRAMDVKDRSNSRYDAPFETADAAALTRHANGAWFQNYGVAPCPVCQPERRRDQRALSISCAGGRLLLHCHKSGCSFRDILSALGELQHLRDPNVCSKEREKASARTHYSNSHAQALWKQAEPIQGTPGEDYFRGRGITCALPPSLRYLPDVWHRPSGNFVSAILARVEPTGGVHRTFLAKTGEQLRKNAKMMLGRCAGGAVRLADAVGPLVVCEGLETGLSLLCGPMRRDHRVWAALSTSGMMSLALPETPGDLIVATDGDEPGRNAGNVLARRAVTLGWKVSLLPAPDGADWNDVLREGGLS